MITAPSWPARPARPAIGRIVLAFALALPAAMPLLPCPVLAQARQEPAVTTGALAGITPEDKAERERELKRLEDTLRRTTEERARLAAEIEQIRTDRARLNTNLVAVADRLRQTETRVAAIDRRLAEQRQREDAIRRSLEGRRGTIIEVLAALQRVGRKPPPAVLVRPDDMLAAVRASIAMGGLLPDLRREAEALAGDLTQLVRLREATQRDRAELQGELMQLVEQRLRLGDLIEARQTQLASSESRLVEERQRALQLARQAQSLRELVQRMETEIAAARRAAEAARAAPPPAQNPAQVAAQIATLGPGALGDPARLQPRIAFQDLRGQVTLPVNGTTVRAFGAPDEAGGTERGLVIATDVQALVTAPADGWIAFAGPYRAYGQVLIINAGGGYHLVLAGMERTSVEIGQFVLSGEPIATMGQAPTGGIFAEAGGGRPVLYIEFRKDGQVIDPGPWWVRAENGKGRG